MTSTWFSWAACADARRRRIWRELEPRLAAAGVTVVMRDGSAQRGYSFGLERTVLLNRSKIMLNIMRQPWDDALYRMLLAAPNGCLLLSEPLCDCAPFEVGRHLATSTLPDMVEAVRYYLRHDDERTRIAANAYQFVTTTLTMKQMAARLLARLGIATGSGDAADGLTPI